MGRARITVEKIKPLRTAVKRVVGLGGVVAVVVVGGKVFM